MGNASIIHSAIWLALVACYDGPPDIQLYVERPAETWEVQFGVCHEGLNEETTMIGPIECDCAPALWFGDDTDLSRRQALYVNDDSDVVYVFMRIVDNTGTTTRVCQRVTLTDSTLVRRVDLDGPVLWSCDTGTCEESYNCENEVTSCR